MNLILGIAVVLSLINIVILATTLEDCGKLYKRLGAIDIEIAALKDKDWRIRHASGKNANYTAGELAEIFSRIPAHTIVGIETPDCEGWIPVSDILYGQGTNKGFAFIRGDYEESEE